MQSQSINQAPRPQGSLCKATPRLGLALALALVGPLMLAAQVQPAEPETVTVIVQAADLETAIEHVTEVGGKITHELKIIRAVACELTQEQRDALEKIDGVRLHENRTVQLEQPNEDNEDRSPSGSR